MTYRHDGELRLKDWFCGAGGSTQGAVAVPGVRPVHAANHWAKAIESHAANFPDVEHWMGDIRDLDVSRLPYAELFWASPECFPAGTLILTDKGQRAIEDIRVGDVVLTHQGRWRPVVRTQNKVADTVVVKGQGHAGIEVTPNHRFWLRPSQQVWRNDLRQYRREYADPAFAPIGESVEASALWATPHRIAPLTPPAPPAAFGLDLTAAWWLVGRWVGDGSLTFGRNHEVLLACGFHEVDALRELLDDTGIQWACGRKRTAAVFSLGDEKARDWLHEHFGHGAAHKGLPAFALTMPRAHRQALLDGYMSADGHVQPGGRPRCSTVSRRLAVDVRLLAETLGHRVTVGMDKRTTYAIEGRTGNALPQWILQWPTEWSGKRSAVTVTDDLHAWSRVRSVRPGRTGVTVYNIEVEEDHSYVAEGIVVANCTNWSRAKGNRQDYAAADTALPGLEEPAPAEEVERSRALMEEVPMYLRAMALRGKPVLAGVVENVVDICDWTDYPRWRAEIEAVGYRTRLIALNSMHAQSVRTARAPQSRDRHYLAYWHTSLGRDPDWDKWLRPAAWCTGCGAWVRAVQVFKDPTRTMGRYRSQYVYRCPQVTCRNQVVEPAYVPAADAIDWSIRGERIGDRAKPLAEKTLARIAAGIRRYARPIHVEAGGHQYDAADPKHRQHGQLGGYYRAWPVEEPLKTLHTSPTKAIVVPPLLVPVEGRDGKQASTALRPLRTQSTRSETAVAVPPSSFIAELRGGGSVARPVTEALATVTASGNHHSLVIPPPVMLMRNNGSKGAGGEHCTPVTEAMRTLTTTGHQSVVSWEEWAALYAYDGGVRDLGRALPTQTTVEGDALITDAHLPAVEDCLFRMLEPDEILRGMAFARDYIVLGNRRERVRQAGNAVTPPAAEVLVSALVECITGEALEPASAA